jgi:hypothetical protein
MSIHRLVKRADIKEKAFNPLLEVLKRRSKNTVECKVVNGGYVSNRQGYGQFTCVESSLRKVPYVTVRITNAQMKVVINDMNDKHRRVKLNHSKSLLNFGDLFYKSSETPPPYVMLYTNRHRIFIDVKAFWWLDDGVAITYDVL